MDVGWSGLADADHRRGSCGDLLDHWLRPGTLGYRGELWLGDRLTGGGLLLVDGRLCEKAVEVAGEVALEAAQRALLRLAFGLLAGEVLLGRRVPLGASDGNDVQRVVELAVPATVQAVPGALAGGAWDRRGTGLQPEA